MSLRREKDFILRMTQEMAKMLAAVLGLRKNQQPELALQKLSEAGGELLGVPKSVLDRLDVASAARLLVDAARIRAYARLVREEAEIRAELGEDSSATRIRARQLLDEAVRLGGEAPEDAAERAALE